MTSCEYVTEGDYFDLADVLAACLKTPCLRVCDGRVTIGWARYDFVVAGELWLAEYDAARKHIRVSRLLDRPWVPRYFLRDTVRHELLHSLIPWLAGEDPHTSEFLAAEARFPGHERAVQWLDRNGYRLRRMSGAA